MFDLGTPGAFPLIPARMVNELAYCPRLYALEHLSGEWADSADTTDGRRIHRRVDAGGGQLPEPEDLDESSRPVVARSISLSDDALGITAKIDLVMGVGGQFVPVDFKRGQVPPNGPWEPERIQVGAQVLLLRAHGYDVPHGELYFAGSRRSVRVEVDDAMVRRLADLVRTARSVMAEQVLPPPLIDSPKCPRCSLLGICLPDETNVLNGRSERVRPLMPARDDALPLYVRAMGGSVGKDHDEIVVREKGEEIGRARLEATSRIALLGNVTVSTPLLREVAERGIPVSVHATSGRVMGMYVPAGGVNVLARIAQHRAAADADASLALARSFVRGKILNARVLLRRNGERVPSSALAMMKEMAEKAATVPDAAALLGVEGLAARVYFEQFPTMLGEALRTTFQMEGRNRRPPRDPVNALLSFAYAILLREVQVALTTVGLDAWVGFLHRPRPGKPALALDLMEEFRPLIADSAVINAVNNEVVTESDFVMHPTGVALTDTGRRSFIRVLERRFDEEINHPVFDTRLSYRRILEVQARLLAKALTGELATYPTFQVR